MVKPRVYYDGSLDPLVDILVAGLTDPETVQYHRTLGKGKKMHRAALLKVKVMIQRLHKLQENVAFPKKVMKPAIEKAVRQKLKDKKM